MGITRDSLRKRLRSTGKRAVYRHKRKHDLGRPPSNTRLGPRRVHQVRCRGGNMKYRGIRLDSGNFAWSSENTTHSAHIVGVVYNPVSNELVRTNTLTKGAIVKIDAIPFRQWYEKHYSIPTGPKEGEPELSEEKKKQLAKEKRKAEARIAKHSIDPAIQALMKRGRFLARISSRPGQVGRADGYILEGEELAFYTRKLGERQKK